MRSLTNESLFLVADVAELTMREDNSTVGKGGAWRFTDQAPARESVQPMKASPAKESIRR